MALCGGGAGAGAGGGAARATLTALSLATSAAPGRARPQRNSPLTLAPRSRYVVPYKSKLCV